MLRPATAARLASVAAITLLAGCTRIAAAQSTRAQRWLDDCHSHYDEDERYCETRESTLPATTRLAVDGRENGGIVVHGWDKNEIHVVAMIEVHDRDRDDARSIAKDISVATSNGMVHAEGPDVGRRQSWAVSYEIWAPRRTELNLDARNGGISVDNVDSRIDMETTNGGIHVTDASGDVHGTTTNGSVTADLTGTAWSGAGLDLRTTNGSVRVAIPSSYNARLETGTVNGGMNIDFPITVQGSIRRRIDTQLGSGGASIRAVTTNGSVSIRRN